MHVHASYVCPTHELPADLAKKGVDVRSLGLRHACELWLREGLLAVDVELD